MKRPSRHDADRVGAHRLVRFTTDELSVASFNGKARTMRFASIMAFVVAFLDLSVVAGQSDVCGTVTREPGQALERHWYCYRVARR